MEEKKEGHFFYFIVQGENLVESTRTRKLSMIQFSIPIAVKMRMIILLVTLAALAIKYHNLRGSLE